MYAALFPILCAFVIDMMAGDPEYIPHPVRWIGGMISYLEKILLNWVENKRFGGILLVIITSGTVYAASHMFVKISGVIHPLLKYIASAVLIYFSVSIKQLYKEGMSVYTSLLNGKITEARKQLSRIVGRDTESLSENEVIRGTVESVSEGIVDSILSPLFFAAIGGAPLCAMYRAVNTLDSMVGYKNEKYIEFGWASARLDDILNYIPARISLILVPLAAMANRKNWLLSFKTALRDSRKHPSPNSGFPEAAMAGALQIRLGGDNYYKGILSRRPFMGENLRDKTVDDILSAGRIMLTTAVFGTASALFYVYTMR